MTGGDSPHGRPPTEAVTLDAHGTLLHLRPPAPRLRRLLAEEGHHHREESVAVAVAAEIRHYRRHLHLGRGAASLAALRRDCAAVIAAELGDDVPPPARLTDIMIDSLRFELAPDAVPALDLLAAAGLRLAVVSNWDWGLPDVLEELGVAGRFEAVVASAAVGSAKPDPAIFLHALAAMGVAPARALHCGDHPDLDCAGARAAGMRAVLIDREGGSGDAGCPRVRSLVEVRALAIC